jgi:hypothetical protein
MITEDQRNNIRCALLSNIEGWRPTFPNPNEAADYLSEDHPTDMAEALRLQRKLIAVCLEELVDVICEHM